MSWSSTSVERSRQEFVMIASDPSTNISECCAQFGISRKTGYKWLKRYKESGLTGLRDKPRRPLNSPNQTSAEVVLQIVSLKKTHPFWGPKKIKVILARKGLPDHIPCVNTIARILHRVGMTEAKGRGRKKSVASPTSLSGAEKPNDVWTTDLKGWWMLADGSKCEPLTVRDLFTLPEADEVQELAGGRRRVCGAFP